MNLKIKNETLLITCESETLELDLADVKTLIERLETIRDQIEEKESEQG